MPTNIQMDKKDEVVSPEELAAEQAAQAEVKEDEVRAGIITEYGFDETADADKIEKLTKKEMEHRKALSTAIGQKIKYRDGKKPPATAAAAATEDKPVVLSTKDMLALQNAGVHEDDVDEVIEFAGFKKIPVSEALKSPLMKSTLAEKAEKRKTAGATQTGTRTPSSGKLSDAQLLEMFSKGELPESQEDMGRLWKLRKKGQK